MLWALSPDPFIRAEVLAAYDAATSSALDWFERHGAVTRRGTDGVHQVDTQGLAMAVFRQHTSRAADPQLHSHAIVTTKVQDPSGRWLALDARFLKRQQRSIGWVYAAALRAELTARLGVAWGPVADGHGDIAGVPEQLLEEFSKRSEQVEARLAELVAAWVDAHDGAEPGPRTLHRLERRAVLDSRPAKEPVGNAEVLRAEWCRRAAAVGVDAVELPTQPALPGTERLDRQALMAEALDRVAADSPPGWRPIWPGRSPPWCRRGRPRRPRSWWSWSTSWPPRRPGAVWSCTRRHRPASPAAATADRSPSTWSTAT